MSHTEQCVLSGGAIVVAGGALVGAAAGGGAGLLGGYVHDQYQKSQGRP